MAVLWNTATEVNSARFEVERSTNGTTFSQVGTVAAAGSGSAPRTYLLVDNKLPTGVARLFYRLRQVDTNGPANYSPVRVILLALTEAPLTFYPNPTHDIVHVRMLGAVAEAPLLVFSSLGYLMRTQPAPRRW